MFLWKKELQLKRKSYFFKRKYSTLSFYKQLVYKQLAFGWKIAKQLSGFNPLSLSKSKTTNKKVEFFLCNKHKITVKLTIKPISAASKISLETFKSHWW